MNDLHLGILLDEASGVPALADRRDHLRRRVRTRRRRRTLAAATVATVTVSLVGTLTIMREGRQGAEGTLSAAPIVSERATAGGDVVAVRADAVGQILIDVGGIEAEASSTDRPVAEYAVIDPPANPDLAVTGSTSTRDEHGRAIVVLVIRVLGGNVQRVRASLPGAVAVGSDEAAPSQGVAVLVLRPEQDDHLPLVRIEALGADGTTSSALDVRPFTTRPWSCENNTQIAQAQPSPSSGAYSDAPGEPKSPLTLIAPPLRAPC